MLFKETLAVYFLPSSGRLLWLQRQQAPLKTSVELYQTTRCHNPEDDQYYIHQRENLRSCLEF